MLLGGGGGGNHGVEAREELVAFARGANRTYAAKGAPLPAEFLRGNALRLDAPGAYDRVYVGAGVADDGAKRAPRAPRLVLRERVVSSGATSWACSASADPSSGPSRTSS